MGRNGEGVNDNLEVRGVEDVGVGRQETCWKFMSISEVAGVGSWKFWMQWRFWNGCCMLVASSKVFGHWKLGRHCRMLRGC